MASNQADAEKAKFIFQQVFEERHIEWDGPTYDFDRSAYKARIDSGILKGQLRYISVESLQDQDVSANDIKKQLLAELK